MESAVKVQWRKKNGKWEASLLTASPDGFNRRGLQPGRKISLELSDERRCTGYSYDHGERAVCPEFRKIESGSQCGECRGKDIYTDYVRGSENSLNGDFSVYMAQIGEKFKVGVTRSENVPKRWVEQGADYAAEIMRGLDSNTALEKEEDLTTGKITQRIRKEHKTGSPREKLSGILEHRGFDAEVVDVQDLTCYPEMTGEIRRGGLFEGEIRSVKGQIIGNGRIGLAVTPGKVVRRPRQKALKGF